MSGMSTVRQETNGCANQYRCALDTYLTATLPSLYVIITNLTINAPGHGNIVVDGLNTTSRCYLKEKMELLCCTVHSTHCNTYSTHCSKRP